MGVHRQPPVAKTFQNCRDPAWALDPATRFIRTERSPRTGQPDRIARTAAVQVIEKKREIANGAPDMPPLVIFEGVQTACDCRFRAETDHIRRKDRSAPLVVDGPDA